MRLDQIFCFFHTKVLSVHAVAVLDDSVKELDMVSDGKILGVSDIFLNGFIHSFVELAMGDVVEAIWEALEGHVVQVAPNRLKRSLYIANGQPTEHLVWIQSIDHNPSTSTAFVGQYLHSHCSR